jgi:hypothetical protein
MAIKRSVISSNELNKTLLQAEQALQNKEFSL